MTPVRLNRAELRHQLAGVDGWIVDELLEIYEAAAIRAMAERRKASADKPEKEGE